ncbi:MAG: radical SAM protein [Candidatus Aenigmarchaeota archaeon]|nr:radical SAM protein [Candidatus Aenigmarchaeota archaeon]
MFNFDREERVNKERIRRLANWFKGKKEGPVQIDAELHKVCNLNCIFCAKYNHEINEKNGITVERWLEIVEEATKLNTLVFNIEGINEPPAIPELFFPVINKVKEVGMYGIVTTNGTLWNEEQLRNLIEIGWDRIHFSLHSPIPKIHDYLVEMNGAWKKTINSIKLLNEWKEKLESSRPMLNINICVNKLNYEKLPEMVKLSHELKADYIFTEPLMVYSEAGRNLKLNSDDLSELTTLIQEANKLAQKYGIDNNFATQDKNLEEEIVQNTSDMEFILLKDVKNMDNSLISAPCFKPWDRIAIRYQGLTGHCGYIEEGEDVKEKSLRNIWFGKFFENARKRMIEKNLFSHCHKCVPSDFTQRRRFRRELIQVLNGV